jgi:hypothetical protein
MMKKRLDEWKQRGYNTLPVESKLSSLSSEEMKNVLKKWKGEYKYK